MSLYKVTDQVAERGPERYWAEFWEKDIEGRYDTWSLKFGGK